MAAEKSKRSRRRRKSSRYLPILWILTGALLALVLILSGNLVLEKDGKFVQPVKPSSGEPSPKTAQSPEAKTKTVKIYLARQLENGVRLVSHTITLSNTPALLQATLLALFSTRDSEDLNLIPPDTKLRRVWVEQSYAHIDLSEDFAYNAYGVQGYKLQIYQIVLTACQFDNIRGVYFSLEGKPLRYLGGEGFPVSSPVLPPKEPFEIPY